MPIGGLGIVALGAANSYSQGRKARKAGDRANATADRSADLAERQFGLSEQLFNDTDPLRQLLIGRSNDFLEDGNVFENPQYLARKDATDMGFNRARDNIIANTAAGGGLTAALAGLEGERAMDMSQAAGGIYGDELARSLSLATGQLPVALGGMGSGIGGIGNAAGIQGNMAAAQMASADDKAGSLGGAFGSFLGAK